MLTLDNAHLNVTGDIPGSTVTITCHPGYHIHGQLQLQGSCLLTGHWSITMESCQRKGNPLYGDYSGHRMGINLRCQIVLERAMYLMLWDNTKRIQWERI